MHGLHLDHEELLRASYSAAGPADSDHLAACAVCAAAVAAMNACRSRLPAEAVVEQLPAAFWQRQRLAILAAAEQSTAAPLRRAAAALSLVVLLMLAALLIGRPGAHKPLPPSIRAEDEQLLHDINLMVNRIEPQALAPARLLFSDQTKEVQRP